jgi:16S rRNA (cytosine1402-N4)-methyltransferase
MNHVPVLLQEAVAALRPRKGKVIADCTVGLGGHAAALLARGARVVGLDLDAGNLEQARVRLEEAGGRFDLRHGNFAGLPGVLGELGIGKVDGILADLGVSSPHLDVAERGFSWRREGPLDMRLDPTRGRTAADLLNSIPEAELAAALRDLGDEEEAERIARLVFLRRPLRTTWQHADLVCEAKAFSPERAARAPLHPAVRTFQAVRMLVNREVANLERLLVLIPQLLAPGGTAAIISFHSGEDRRVKHSFRDGFRGGVYAEMSPDPVVPSAEELEANPRAASAKLRWIRMPKAPAARRPKGRKSR